jgi:hypothetical protein
MSPLWCPCTPRLTSTHYVCNVHPRANLQAGALLSRLAHAAPTVVPSGWPVCTTSTAGPLLLQTPARAPLSTLTMREPCFDEAGGVGRQTTRTRAHAMLAMQCSRGERASGENTLNYARVSAVIYHRAASVSLRGKHFVWVVLKEQKEYSDTRRITIGTLTRNVTCANTFTAVVIKLSEKVIRKTRIAVKCM